MRQLHHERLPDLRHCACDSTGAFSTCYCSCTATGATDTSCALSCASSSCETTAATCITGSIDTGGACATACGAPPGGAPPTTAQCTPANNTCTFSVSGSGPAAETGACSCAEGVNLFTQNGFFLDMGNQLVGGGSSEDTFLFNLAVLGAPQVGIPYNASNACAQLQISDSGPMTLWAMNSSYGPGSVCASVESKLGSSNEVGIPPSLIDNFTLTLTSLGTYEPSASDGYFSGVHGKLTVSGVGGEPGASGTADITVTF